MYCRAEKKRGERRYIKDGQWERGTGVHFTAKNWGYGKTNVLNIIRESILNRSFKRGIVRST